MKNQNQKNSKNNVKHLYLTNFQLVLFIGALVLIIVCFIVYYQLQDDSSLIISILSSIIAALLCSAIINIYEIRRKDMIDNDEKKRIKPKAY